MGLWFHDLRRSAARNCKKAGIPETVIMAMGGWKTRSVYDRYGICGENDLASAADAYDRYLADTLSGNKTTTGKVRRLTTRKSA